ncbi:MAG: LysE family transporter [Candidatus Kapaibacterium sp.]
MALVIGLLVGYVLAIPPGPIGMAAIRYGMMGRMRDAVHLAAGAGVLDLLYCVIAMWTSAGLLDAIMPGQFAGEHDVAIAAAKIAIALIMVVAGIVVMRSSAAEPQGAAQTSSPTEQSSRWKGLAPFMTGVGFAVTNLANPTFVPSLMVMSGTIRSAGLVGLAAQDTLLFSAGFGAGNTLWLVTLGLLTCRYRHRVSDGIVVMLRRGLAVTLIVAGVYFGLRAGLGMLQ